MLLAQNAAGFTHLFKTLDLLHPDIEQPDRRPFQPVQDARRGRTHDREVDKVLGIGADRGADVEHDQFAAQGRPQRRDGGARDPGQRFELEFRHRHQRAGIARRYGHVGFLLFD